jgi:leader peptidase (prepilin peptidase) / N-methyltransferase
VLTGAVLGAIAGSFIATLTERWPAGEAITGRSHCSECARQLAPLDLVPILSWLLLRGRCRTCSAEIGSRAPLVEGAAAAIGALAFLASPSLEGSAGALFGWLLLTLALLDLEHFWLPDRLTVALIVSGFLSGLVIEYPPFADRIFGAAAGFLALELIRTLYRIVRKKEGLGGGDPKLFAGIGAWLGWQILPFALLSACLIGLITVLVSRLRGREIRGDQPVPFGALLCFGSFPFWMFLEFYKASDWPMNMSAALVP